MFDINLIRTDAEKVAKALGRKGAKADIAGVKQLDEKRRLLVTERDDLRKRRNEVSKMIGKRKPSKHFLEHAEQVLEVIDNPPVDPLRAESIELGHRIDSLEKEIAALDEQLQTALLGLPNLPSDDVPDGTGADDNKTVRTWGEVPEIKGFEPQAHWDLGEKLGILDLGRAAKLSGSGFALFVGDGSRLVRSLVNWFLDVQTRENGYTEVWPPALVNAKTMTGTGQLPKFEEELYKLRDDPLYLIPTAEVPVTNIYQDEILDEADLPRLLTAYTPCFRREAGAAGRETRGMIRVHQFDKVEMVKFTTPEQSPEEHEKLTRNAEGLLERLGLPYRRLLLCAGDMSASAAKCYDLEVYAAGVKRWLEVSSCSNFTDYQARRANIRYRTKDGKVRLVHTLNGSGLAVPRVFIAILENNQQADGTVKIPEVLRPYMGKEFIGK